MKLKLFTAALWSVTLAVAVRAHAEPTVQACLAANETSIALRASHKPRAARDALLACVAPTCPSDIQKACIARMDQVMAELPTLVFQATDSGGADLTRVRVAVDGEPLLDVLDGTAVAVEPGQHSFRFEAEGYPVIEKQILIHESEKGRHEQVVFALAKTKDATKPESRVRTRSYDWVALSSAAVGVVGLGVGTVFGFKSISLHNAAQQTCPGECTDDAGVQAWKDARYAGNVSTVGFIVGGIGAATAVTFFILGKRQRGGAATAQLALAPGQLTFEGTW